MTNTLIMIGCTLIILGIAFALSDDRKNVNIHTVINGIIGLLALVLFTTKTKIGSIILENVALGVDKVAQFGLEGVGFVFGELSSNMFVFGINVLGLLIFTSAFISVLNYIGILPLIIKYVGGAISKALHISKAEGICSFANVLLGQTESPLLTKSYLSKMTDSELFTVLVSGMGSASASILIGYSMIGIPMKYMLIAVFAVPFSTVIISKIMKPNRDVSIENVQIEKSNAVNLFDAIGQGTRDGLGLALNVGASLIAFIGLVAVLNAILGIFGVSLSEILGFILYPLGWLFNIPQGEISTFASLIGTKISINEFVAFTQMSEVLNTLSPRTIAILATVMCNFGAIGSIGICLGGLSAIEPKISGKVAVLVGKALVGAILASLLSGAIVGLLF